jgi:hypothetical protein
VHLHFSGHQIDARHADAPVRFLYSHAIELYLKSYLLLNRVTVEEPRSHNLGHNINALRTEAQSFGLTFNKEQENQLDLLSEAIFDRYIETGSRVVLLPTALHGLCVYLHGKIGPAIRKSNDIKRGLPPLI